LVIAAKVGMLTFFKSLQIANQQILGLIPLSQICKFLGYANPQITNAQFLYGKSANRKFICCSSPLTANLQPLHHRTPSFSKVQFDPCWLFRDKNK
jgi:hypothetical protein